MSHLPQDAEAVVRAECAEAVMGLVRAVDDASRRLHQQGDDYLDTPGRTDFMRGYYLGAGRGLQIATTSIGHVLNWAVRRGLK